MLTIPEPQALMNVCDASTRLQHMIITDDASGLGEVFALRGNRGGIFPMACATARAGSSCVPCRLKCNTFRHSAVRSRGLRPKSRHRTAPFCNLLPLLSLADAVKWAIAHSPGATISCKTDQLDDYFRRRDDKTRALIGRRRTQHFVRTNTDSMKFARVERRSCRTWHFTYCASALPSARACSHLTGQWNQLLRVCFEKYVLCTRIIQSHVLLSTSTQWLSNRNYVREQRSF